MQVTKDNFKEVLPLVVEAVGNASFLAIDGEFTGLDIGQTIHSFDSLQERYLKQRKAAKAYIILQFGVSAFQYDPEQNHYKVQSFNFYICPRPYGRHAPDRRFECQSSSMDFLSSNGLNFNKVFHEGISYMLPSETQKMLDVLKQHHESHNSETLKSPQTVATGASNASESPALAQRDLIPVPDEHKPFIANIMQQVDDFYTTHETDFLDLKPSNGFMRKLTYQSVRQKYGNKLFLESVPNSGRAYIRVQFPKTAEECARLEKDRQNAERQQIDDAAGFSKVVKLISQSGKLVVGHNMMLDMLHVLEQFVSPLPEEYEEFKDLLRCVFPRLLDTKYLATSQQLKDFLPNTTLADMQKDLEKMPFSKPKVVNVSDDVGYSSRRECLHEAGYDSYISGLCFISMVDYLGSISKPPVAHLDVDSVTVRQFWNKLHVMRMTDISFINLEGPDAKSSREHVFHLTFPKSWKADDIHQLFSAFGNIQIVWLNDTSAYVGLYRRDQAHNALKSLSSASGRVYRLLTYEQFSASVLPKTPLADCDRAHLYVKHKLSDVVSSPVIVSRKRSCRSSFGSSEITTIPEEDVNEVIENEVEDSSPVAEEPLNKISRMSVESNAGKMFDVPNDW